MEKTAKTFRQFLTEKYETKYEYSSTQINLPPQMAKIILEWGDAAVPDDIVYHDPSDPTFGREDELHVTVLYGIHTGDPRSVEKLLLRQKPFGIDLGKLSVFTSNDNFDVLKVDVQSEALHRLYRSFSNGLKATESYPEYIPHITIAYVKKRKADALVGADIFSDKSFRAEEVVFSSKDGDKTKIRIGEK